MLSFLILELPDLMVGWLNDETTMIFQVVEPEVDNVSQ